MKEKSGLKIGEARTIIYMSMVIKYQEKIMECMVKSIQKRLKKDKV